MPGPSSWVFAFEVGKTLLLAQPGNKVLKDGEVYNSHKKKWYTRSGTKASAMMTGDKLGQFRTDNHAWLFGWKNETIFQGGLSVDMNWYTVQGKGDTIPAGH